MGLITDDAVELGQGRGVVLGPEQLSDFLGIDVHAGSLLELGEGVDRRDAPQELLHRDDVVFSGGLEKSRGSTL